MKKLFSSIGGFFAGVLNGLLGAGGGIIVVPILTKLGLPRQKAHATSVFIILPLCIFSAVLYLKDGKVSLNQALPYMGFGIIGAIIGTFILQRINEKLLKKIFALLMIWAGIRMIFK